MGSYIIKFVNGNYRNKNAVDKVIRYIYKGAKKELASDERIYGAVGCGSADKKKVIRAFKKVKFVYGKTEGCQLKHIVISFGFKPDVSVKKIRRAVKDILRFFTHSEMPEGNFQVAYGIHYSREENYHLHLCINSVSNRGKCLNINGFERRRFGNYVNEILDLKCSCTKGVSENN